MLSRGRQTLQKAENIQNSEVNSNFSLKICCKHNTFLQPVNFHYSGAFYSIILKIFGFNCTSVLVRYFGSISRFGCFLLLCRPKIKQLWLSVIFSLKLTCQQKNTATIFVYRISGTKFGEKKLGSRFKLKILNQAGKQKYEVFLKVFGYSSVQALNERISEWAYFLNLDQQFQRYLHFSAPKKEVLWGNYRLRINHL